MRAAVAVPVTVKTRLGVDDHDSYEFVRDFIARSRHAGCDTFIVHARKAWLSGLEPEAESRDSAARLRARASVEARVSGAADRHQRRARDARGRAWRSSQHVDGVMLGRAAYEDSWLVASLDARLFGGDAAHTERGARALRAVRRARARDAARRCGR